MKFSTNTKTISYPLREDPPKAKGRASHDATPMMLPSRGHVSTAPRLQGFWIKQYAEMIDRPEYALLPDNLWRRVSELRLLLAHDATDGILPDTRTMAFRLRRSEQQIHAELEELVAHGLISKDGNGCELPHFSEEQGSDSVAERKARQRKKDWVSRISHADVTNRDTDKNRVDKNKKDNTPLPPAGGMEEAVVNFRDWSAEFEAFWNEYPDHRKYNRYRAESTWSGVQALLPPLQEVLGALAAFKASKKWRDEQGKFVPAPHAWLEEHRWQDAPALMPNTKPKQKISDVDEDDALRWRLETYPDSQEIHPTWRTFPFAKWPEVTKGEYREAKKVSSL